MMNTWNNVQIVPNVHPSIWPKYPKIKIAAVKLKKLSYGLNCLCKWLSKVKILKAISWSMYPLIIYSLEKAILILNISKDTITKKWEEIPPRSFLKWASNKLSTIRSPQKVHPAINLLRTFDVWSWLLLAVSFLAIGFTLMIMIRMGKVYGVKQPNTSQVLLTPLGKHILNWNTF